MRIKSNSFIITSTLLTVIMVCYNSCSIEKRVHYSGYHVEKKSFDVNKNVSDIETNSSTNNRLKVIIEDYESYKTSSENVTTTTFSNLKLDTVIHSKLSTKIATTTNNRVVIPAKKFASKFIDNISVNMPQHACSVKGTSNIMGNPCPDPGRSKRKLGKFLIIFGAIFLGVSLYIALILVATGSSPGLLIAPLIGLILLITGIVVYNKGKKIPSPTIIRTEMVNSLANSAGSLLSPSFDYNPPNTQGKKSTISLVLLAPQYATRFEQARIQPFKEFADRMEEDFKELLNRRGYTFRGPVETYDDLVYGDKANTDLLVEIKIDFNLNFKNFTSTSSTTQVVENRYWSCGKVEKINKGSRTGYTYKGNVEISGTINVIVSEVMTKEKVWTKSVTVPNERIYIQSEKIYDTNSPSYDYSLLFEDPGVFNPITSTLEDIYQTTMQKAWIYLDPSELELLIPQVEKIRANSGYGRNISR